MRWRKKETIRYEDYKKERTPPPGNSDDSCDAAGGLCRSGPGHTAAACEELFTFPGGSADQILAAAQDDSSGTDTEAQSGGLSQTIQEVYGDYFTESGLQNFYRSGFPLNLYYAAQEKDCEISFEKIRKSDASGDQENTERYEAEIRVNGDTVHQEIDTAFEDGKVDYFYFADDELMTAIENIL